LVAGGACGRPKATEADAFVEKKLKKTQMIDTKREELYKTYSKETKASLEKQNREIGLPVAKGANGTDLARALAKKEAKYSIRMELFNKADAKEKEKMLRGDENVQVLRWLYRRARLEKTARRHKPKEELIEEIAKERAGRAKRKAPTNQKTPDAEKKTKSS
jgi:hypothetical protein